MSRFTVETFTGPLSFPEKIPPLARNGGEGLGVKEYQAKLTKDTLSHLYYAGVHALLTYAFLFPILPTIQNNEPLNGPSILLATGIVPAILGMYHAIAAMTGSFREAKLEYRRLVRKS